MYGNSRIPASAQTGIHPQLSRMLDRHAGALFRRPFADYNRAAFVASWARFQDSCPDAPLILDSGCGTGESSRILAQAFPGHYVIGVDQSAARLARSQRAQRAPRGASDWPPNLDLVRADVVDYWRLLRDAGVRLDRHYLLYPNPWPKIAHLGRRWHGHPVFPTLLALGGVLECRSNWAVYLAELCLAVQHMTQRATACEEYRPEQPLTPFERKYLASGHRLFRTVIDLR